MQKRTWKPTVDGTVALVPLTRGLVAAIDFDDLPLVTGSSWGAISPGGRIWYACSNDDQRLMHRVIMGCQPGDPHIDHVDHDGLNNRRANLRVASHSQNAANGRSHVDSSSTFKGVSWDASRSKWRAQIKDSANRSNRFLGRFDNEEEAARAYDAAAIEAWGQFAATNYGIDDENWCERTAKPRLARWPNRTSEGAQP